jgi:sn-glycerol 3-phosphate transport system substrate-binding protein
MKNYLLALSVSMAVAGAANAQEPIKFKFWHALSGAQEIAVTEMCNKFNSSQDKYQVECTSYKKYDRTLQAAVAAYRVHKQPAIVQASEVSTADMVASGTTIPYKTLMEENGYKIDWNDFISGVSGYYSDSNHNLQAYPFNPSTLVMYVNKTKLKAAGIQNIPETWEQAEKAMKALKGSGEDCAFGMRIDSWRHLEQLSAVHNAPIATNRNGFDGSHAKFDFNKGVEVKHIANMKRWYDDGLMTLQGAMAGINLAQAFQSGKCAIVMDSSGRYGAAAENIKDFEWGIAKIPVYEGTVRHNAIIGGGALWTLNKLPDNVYPGVAAFYNFISSKEEQIDFSSKTGYMPNKISTIKQMEKDGSFSSKLLGGLPVIFDSLNNYETGDYNQGIRLGFFPQFRATWKTQVELVFDNQKTPQEAMDYAAKEGNKLLERFNKTYQL